MTKEAERGRTYRGSGVDIDAGNRLVEAIKPLARATARSGMMGGIGGFGGLFDPKAAGFRDPIIVATTDGVGTKLKLAQTLDRHDGVGVDLVAMCVNDLVVQGAEPLFFLDYFATGRLEVGVAERVVAGIAEGCRQAGAALLGGETAEMPGFYQPGEYDLAGFAVGAVERDAVLTGAGIAPGDVVLALPSSGIHSNGYSLVRRVVEDLGLDLSAPAPFAPHAGLGELLVTPTRIYVKACLAACRTGKVKGMAHITGGGLYENLPRVLPDGLGARIDASAWTLPPVFAWLADGGGIAPDELARTFNCGLGMMLVTAPDAADAVIAALGAAGEPWVVRVGEIVERAGEPRVVIEGIDRWRTGSTSAS